VDLWTSDGTHNQGIMGYLLGSTEADMSKLLTYTHCAQQRCSFGFIAMVLILQQWF